MTIYLLPPLTAPAQVSPSSTLITFLWPLPQATLLSSRQHFNPLAKDRRMDRGTNVPKIEPWHHQRKCQPLSCLSGCQQAGHEPSAPPGL